MKLSLRNLFAAAGLLVAATTGARAEEISLAPNFEPFAAPGVTLVSHCTDGCADGCNNGCNNGCTTGCSDSCCNSCCTSRHVGRDFWTCNDRCGGIVGGAEFLLIEPFAEDGIVGPGTPGIADIGLSPAYRLWGGWENSDGLGVRLRYFTIDADEATAVSFSAVEYRYIDAEMTQAVAFRRSSLQFASGVRYAEAQNTLVLAVPGVAGIAAANEFDGIGVTFAMQANRDISRNGALRMTANARWSLLYGDNDALFAGAVAGLGGAAVVIGLEDELMQIIELQVGPQLRMKMNNGAYLTAFGGVEAQYWQNGFSTPVPGLSIDTGFAGLATSVSITR